VHTMCAAWTDVMAGTAAWLAAKYGNAVKWATTSGQTAAIQAGKVEEGDGGSDARINGPSRVDVLAAAGEQSYGKLSDEARGGHWGCRARSGEDATSLRPGPAAR
jgi:hypothetical protein